MLPAKFRGFASRVGRLASRALAWRKTSERDGAVRTSHTLRRALFAMLVAAATIVTILVVPPVHNTNAAGKANVFWDYIGTGYISPSSVSNNDIWRDIDFQNPVIKTENVNGRKKTTITWEVLYNKEACRIRAMENPLMKCDPKDGSHSYDGQPEFYAVLPSGVKDETVRITRYRTEFDRTGFYNGRPAKFYSWHLRGNENEEPGKFNSGTNVTRVPGDSEYDELWNQHIATCGIFSNEACEAWNWKKQGKFGRLFKTWEQNNSVSGIRWIISAEVKDDQDPYNLPFMAGFVSYRNGSDKNKFIIWGPYDHDGDGIPDSKEWHYGFNPTSNDDVQFPKKSKKDAVYGEITDVDPYFKTGHWDGTAEKGKWIYDNTEKPFEQTDTGITFSFKKSGGKEVLPSGVTKANSPNNMQPGQAYIDPITGKIKYNPKKTDRGHTIHFYVQITYPNPSANSCKYKQQVEQVKRVDIRIVSQASIYNPHYDETTVNYDTNNNRFNPTDSKEPKSVKDSKKPWVREGALPSGSTFKLEKYTQYTSPVLDWSKIDSKNTGNGKVTFSPSKTEAGTSDKTPVLVTYPDGSTSKDSDAGNYDKVVYAPVKVQELPVTDGDLHLNLYDGTQINNGQFGGWSFGDANNPKELSKTTKIGGPKDNKNNGIVLDSWANNAKGPITFRAVCHKKNDTKYKLLKPAEGNSKASGDINGLQFEEFRQWKRGNDKNCKDKNTCDLNTYLHNSEYNKDTMERSRALIGGKPKEGGEYECKVFAFHQAHDGKGMQHNGALTKFDNLAKDNGAGFVFAFDTGAFASSKGKEWVSCNFYFKIKLKDSQKYNPTYKTIPTIQAGTFANKETNSSGQPKSHTKIMVDGQKVNANGVPDEDLGGVEDGKALPPGTWFEIKKLVKKVDKTQPDKFPSENELWSNFEGGEDNVKRDNSGKPVMEKGKVVPLNETGREYGSVTFRPDKWKDAGQYWAEVVVHYPDGSTSDGEGSINKDHPIYAKVNVTRDDAHNQFGLALYKDYPNKSMGNGYDLKVGESPSPDATFDSWLTKSVGPIHLHMICSKNTKDGTKTKQTEYTYNRLPGHTESEGLRLKDQKIWGHATFDQQKSCIKDRKACTPDTLLYDDWVPGGNSNNTSERTRGFFGGKAQKTGDYDCKVYAIRGDKKKSDAFEKAVKANIEKNKKNKKDVDPVDGVLKTKDNKYPYGTDGQGYKTDTFAVRIHNDNQLYNPTYTNIPTIEAGSTFDKNLNNNKSAISSGAPQSKKKIKDASGKNDVNANGVSDFDLQNVKEGPLPKGTWYEIKRFVKSGDISKTSAKNLPWANFEDGEDNKADGKQEAKDENATNKGSVTFRPDKWQDADEYWAEIRVHYPDGTTSDGEGSINKDHPIYAKVKVTRPAIDSGDLHLNVYKQYENGKFTGYVDDVNGITVMKGVGLLKDMGIDSWSTAKPEGITLRALCRDDSDEAKKSTTHIWSENLDNLFFKLNWQKSWDHADFQKQETCRKSGKKGDGCNPEGKYLLFDSTGGTMERASGTITSDKAPTKSGKYYCVVLAMKLTDLGKYKKAIKNSKISVTNNNFAKAMGFTDTEGIDWTAKYFPVTVVEKFALPKTGGEGMSMALLVVAMIGMCVMCGAFFVDQTKWGHAMLVGAAGAAVRAAVSAAAGMMRGLRGATQNSNSNRNSKISEIWRGLVKKVKDIRRFDDYSASVKDFVRKATGWLRAALRRVGRWAAERWRC
ncbi:Rib/alpha-like domain-containing protein [Gardnerella vaginalis]|uniref:Rib/alpha-like domain-containing protein n=1 Tax=Gardnerella vaginalis TaxID=2702 RepID=UPI001FF5CB9F|nr:Rib/alpha-like domain-containing protein [Gardnerella vaginalis]